MSRPIGVGVIGLGFMGQTHARAVQRAQRDGINCRLVALADRTGDLATGAGNIATGSDAIDLAGVERVDSIDALLAVPGVDLVNICTHTQTHIELAERAIAAGRHVLIEKPVALRPEPIDHLHERAHAAGVLAMPAMCMRFWPAWTEMARLVRTGELGAIRSASLARMGARPGWSPDFYGDDTRTGGPLADLHIHDCDYLTWLFGPPATVQASGDPLHFTARYAFADGPAHAVGEAGWDLQPSFGFRMRATIIGEHATLDFDIGRDEQLRLHGAEGTRVIDCGPLTGYDGEIRAMIAAIAAGAREAPATLAEAASVMRTLEALRQSLASCGQPVAIG